MRVSTTDSGYHPEPLRPADVLAAATLYELAGTDAPTPEPITTVRCGQPLCYPVPAGALPPPLRERAGTAPERYAGALFAFDLSPLPPGQRYGAVRLLVHLADPRIRALRLDLDADTAGLGYGPRGVYPASPLGSRTVAAAVARPDWLRRLVPRSGEARAWPTGVASSRLGWVYDDPYGDRAVPQAIAVHALLAVPPGTTELRGGVAVQVEVVRAVRGRSRPVPGGLRDEVPFRAPLPQGADAPVPGPAVRLCVAADVEGYSLRRNEMAARTQRYLVDILASARAYAGVDESEVDAQPQGDGQFAVLPAGIDEAGTIPALLDGLRLALATANEELDPGERIRLRVALHRSLVEPAPNGWAGTAATSVQRLLDAAPVRAALREHPGAEFALVVPDFLYTDVIAPGPLAGYDFRPVTVDLPEKRFVAHGWLHVADRPR